MSKLQHSSKPLPFMFSLSVIQNKALQDANGSAKYFLPHSRFIRKVKWDNTIRKEFNNKKDFQAILSVSWKIQLTRTQFPRHILQLKYTGFNFQMSFSNTYCKTTSKHYKRTNTSSSSFFLLCQPSCIAKNQKRVKKSSKPYVKTTLVPI